MFGALLVTSWNNGEAVIIRQLLATYGIPCQVISGIHSIMPFALTGFAEIRILVAPSRLAEATELLAAHRRQGYRLIRGGKSQRNRPPSERGSRGHTVG